ncbi:alpha/beta hydrolase [Rhizobium sp. RAF56]|uniref:alpha/beta hydrolase n=1 Tax=Rhizobium sp. RAF56 TaxID=3233062 RepID=UPI003F972644
METDPFRIRGHVADFDAIVAEIVEASARTRDRLPMVPNVPYGESASETVDIFFPEGSRQNLPVHMFIHGGYWRMFSKKDYSYVADTVTRAGAIAVIVDYALMPGVRMDVLVDQVRAAKRWVLERISSYGGDPACLSISGHSAGAHLASFLFHRGDTKSDVGAALLLSGIFDLEPLQKSFLQAEIAITDEEVAAFSPLTHTHDESCHVVVAVGADETPPFHRQANEFASSLEKQGLTVVRRAIGRANHMSSVRDLGIAGTATAELLSDVIARSL